MSALGSPRLYICGQLAIEYNNVVIRESEFPARQSRRLWAYLVINHRRPVGRDELVDAIWGDDLPDTWSTTINALVSRLRRTLRAIPLDPDEFGIHGEVGRYSLRLPDTTFIDYERARTAIHTTETLLRQGRWNKVLGEARVAMEIAARSLLIGEEGPWIHGERSLLEDIHFRALECTIECELQRGNSDLAEREALEIIRLDHLRESGYRLLMRSLAARGNIAGIPAVMDECRTLLFEQLGITPSSATEELYAQLIAR